VAELPRPLPPPTWRDRLEVVRGVPLGVVAVVVAGALVSIGVTYALTAGVGRGGVPDVALTLPRADAPAPGDAPTTTAGGDLHVHAAGAVVQPGVVTVPSGARVTDVVAAAGGPAPDADLNQVNLAAPVSDGERVYIPRQGEVASTASGGTAAAKGNGLVNINEADQAALDTLPGVGPSTAQAIIDYRKTHGRFRSVDDLLNVRGIGPAKLSQIKPHARV